MKYAWIAEQGQRYPLVDMCDALEVSISLKTVVTPFRQHYFGEVRLFEVGQTRPMYV